MFSGSSGVLSFSNFVFRPSDGVSPALTYSGVSEKQILCFAFFASFFWILSIFWIVRTFWIVRLFQTFSHCDKFHKLIVRIIRVIWKLLKLSENLNFIYFLFFYWHCITSRGTIVVRGDFHGLITIPHINLKVKLLENVVIFRQFRILELYKKGRQKTATVIYYIYNK